MIHRKEIEIGGKQLIIETGKLAKQAHGSAWVQYGETVILATAVAETKPREGLSFFPLTVEYRERAYAVGKIPGGFFKREGRPSEKETLSARFIDRSLRPLFPDGFRNEVQIFVTVLSADRENDSDVLGIIGASTALCISHAPFAGPVGGVRIGMDDDGYLVNPTFAQLEESKMNMVVSSTRDFVLMVEGSANEVSEADALGALKLGHECMQPVLDAQLELVDECGNEKMVIPVVDTPEGLTEKVDSLADDKIRQAVRIQDRQARKEQFRQIRDDVVASLAEEYPEADGLISGRLHDIEKAQVRSLVINDSVRLDGRGKEDIRDITCDTAVLPRTHGSAIFTRGQTQALAVVTLGTKMDEQKIDDLEGEFWKSYMLHYNFPPFSVGETRPLRGPGRREIGHGNLAERALKPMLPNEGTFPYTIRIVSDILESNGSSSMATVCAGSLAAMDAGVPVKAPVAGIAMGLVKEGDSIAVLSDILGDEDHLGDMDFKVAGTAEGITAFQMDAKIAGISFEILQQALNQARAGRLHILEVMNQELDHARPELSQFAPRILNISIPVDSIGAVIGPGGKMIREIIERTGATIDIADDGTVTIASVDPEAGNMAKKIIEELTEEPEIGRVYKGKVKKITNFGAFVEILPGREGLLHISEIEHRRIDKVEDVLKMGQEVNVKLLNIDANGKFDLSRKVLLEKGPESSGGSGHSGGERRGGDQRRNFSRRR